jgi:hypothetical protein
MPKWDSLNKKSSLLFGKYLWDFFNLKKNMELDIETLNHKIFFYLMKLLIFYLILPPVSSLMEKSLYLLLITPKTKKELPMFHVTKIFKKKNFY